MSLPQAVKEISAHPGKNTVTSPTVKADLEEDVDRKMRLYGVIQAFRQNRLPDNAQIDDTLKYVAKHSPVDEKKLSHEGQKLVNDVRDIIETARVLVKEKNADELFQNFLYHTTHTEAEIPEADTGVLNGAKDDTKRDGRQAVEHLRTLLSLILTNSEARKLLSDVSLIGRDLFARGAIHVADAARPDPDALARVDEAAPSSHWKVPNGQFHRMDRSSTLSSNEQRESASETPGRAEQTGEQFKDGKGNAVAETRQPQSDAGNPENKAEATRLGPKDWIKGLKDKIPQEHRDRASDGFEKGVQALKDEFPEERRDQFIYRLKKVLVECQKHSDYQEALTWFLDAIETYFGHGRTLVDHHVGKVGETANDPNLQRAGSELRTLLERFANGKSIGDILDASDQLNTDVKEDEALAQWFKELDAFVRKTLLEPGYVISSKCNTDANRLRDTGYQFFDEKYKGHKDNLFDSVQAWFLAWSDDALNKRFGEDWKRLTKDLLFAEDGSLSFKPHLWTDIRKVIIPQLIRNVGYIPIPRIEYTDNSIDLVIENLTMEGSNILPNIVSVDAHNYFEFSPYESIPDQSQHDFEFTMTQIQADMRDVAFYFNKKSGLPRMKDSGLADVFLGGEGLKIKVHLTGAGKDQSSVFKVKDVHCKVDSLKFSVRDTKHDILYKTLKPLATGLVKKQISRVIEDAVRTGLEFLDEQLVGVRDRYEEARKSDDISTTIALASLFERKPEEVSSKAESKKKPDAHFKIVSNRGSVIIPQGHESGFVHKLAERESAAKQGQGWRSPAFNILPPPDIGGVNAPASVA